MQARASGNAYNDGVSLARSGDRTALSGRERVAAYAREDALLGSDALNTIEGQGARAHYQRSICVVSKRRWVLSEFRLHELCVEVVTFVIDDDECGEVLNVDSPDRLHAELGILDALDICD